MKVRNNEYIFFIGNGFDINLGLKTSYNDFYSYYKIQDSKNMLSESINKNINLWSDLELGLGRFLSNISENQINDFLNCKSDLEKHLIDYLKIQDKKIILNETAFDSFKNGIIHFYNDFPQEEKNQLLNSISNSHNSINYRFATFNYTHVLDKLIKGIITKYKKLLTHIFVKPLITTRT